MSRRTIRGWRAVHGWLGSNVSPEQMWIMREMPNVFCAHSLSLQGEDGNDETGCIRTAPVREEGDAETNEERHQHASLWPAGPSPALCEAVMPRHQHSLASVFLFCKKWDPIAKGPARSWN